MRMTPAMHILLAALFILATTSAWAEWVRYAEDNELVVYFDPATIRKDGSLRRMWALQDFKKRGSDGELSHRALMEYDCKEERLHTLSVSGHSGSMASGKLVFSSNHPDKWTYVPPGTVAETALRLVCAQ